MHCMSADYKMNIFHVLSIVFKGFRSAFCLLRDSNATWWRLAPIAVYPSGEGQNGATVNNCNNSQKAAHWIHKFSQCQLNVQVVVSRIFVFSLLPMLVRFSPQRPRVRTWVCVYLLSACVFLWVCVHIWGDLSYLFEQLGCAAVVRVMCGGMGALRPPQTIE